MASLIFSTKDVATQDITSLLKRIMTLKEGKDQSIETVSVLLGHKEETGYSIQNTLLDLSNFKPLNEECSMLLFAIADTGARIPELVGLNSEQGDICLEAEVPYIYIRPDKKRALKAKVSERKIPLVGVSLYTFKKLPKGFQHYYQKADLISATLH